jgi:hypothetical protein
MDRREKKICLCRKQFKHKRGLHDCGCPCHSWSKELKVNVDRREELAEVIDKSFMCWIQDSAKSGDKIFFDCRTLFSLGSLSITRRRNDNGARET